MEQFEILETWYARLKKFEFFVSLNVFGLYHTYFYYFTTPVAELMVYISVVTTFFGTAFVLLSVFFGENDFQSDFITEFIFGLVMFVFNLASGILTYDALDDGSKNSTKLKKSVAVKSGKFEKEAQMTIAILMFILAFLFVIDEFTLLVKLWKNRNE